MIYLDNAATSPIRPEVLLMIQRLMADVYGNPSSTYQLGKIAKRELEQARQTIATALGVKAQHVYFTSGATESNNWAIQAQAHRARQLNYGNHLVCLAVEHPSVSETVSFLEQNGFEVSWIHPSNQMSDAELVVAFQMQSTDTTIGWICMAVNNEVGTCYPVEQLTELAKAHGYFCHVDVVQAAGRIALNYARVGSSFSLSGHKLGAPKGIGILVYQPWDVQMSLQPLLHGGGQERGLRSGTENIPYIVGLAEAIRLAIAEQPQKEQLHGRLRQVLQQLFDEAEVIMHWNVPGEQQVAAICNIWLPGVQASQALIQLDLADIYVSAGSACSAGSLKPSRILQNYYPNQPERWNESIRISFGNETSQEDLVQLVTQIKQLKERKVSLWHSQNKQP